MARGAHSLALGPPPHRTSSNVVSFHRGPERRDVLEGRRETFGLRMLAGSKRTVCTGERGRGPGTPRSRARPEGPGPSTGFGVHGSL